MFTDNQNLKKTVNDRNDLLDIEVEPMAPPTGKQFYIDLVNDELPQTATNNHIDIDFDFSIMYDSNLKAQIDYFKSMIDLNLNTDEL